MFFLTKMQARAKDPAARRRAAERLGRGARAADDAGALPAHVALLVTLLADADAGVRSAALDALGRVGNRQAAEAMAASLKDADALPEPGAAAVRESATRGFHGIGASAMPALQRLLKEKNPKLREAAAAALGGIPGPEAEQALTALLQDGRSNVRQAAVRALAHGAAAGSIGALSAALEHKDPATRKTALEAVAALKGAAAASALERLARDADRGVRELAVRSLAAQGSPEAVDVLLRVFEGPDRDLRSLAARELKTLQWQPASAAQRALHAILRADYRTAASEGEAAVEPLSALLTEKSADTRRAAVEALGMVAHAAAVKPLVVALQDADPVVRQAAGDALVNVGVPAVEPLVSAVHDTARAAAPDIVARIGGPASEPLVGRLEQGDPYSHDGTEVLRVDDAEAAESAAHAAHLLARVLGRSSHAVEAACLRRIGYLRDLVRVREIPPVNRRELPTVVVDTVVDCSDLRERAAAELERRK